jgi:hypothetical protein
VPASFFNGAVDELKVYNYSISNDQAIQKYYDYTGNKVCIEYPLMDFTGPNDVKDCVVDIYDFAHFAASWLESGLRPE